MYFWSHWVLVAAPRLLLAVEGRDSSQQGRAQALGTQASLAAACGLSSQLLGSRAPAQ